ncbi:hypothetical protein [Algoriphagus sp.]|uniref:hypothetical protein n=1 Tax=Algoriphagus sp. TaxID=1872435 RepID=UPI0025F95ACC|nr:hypothetical protein [Algoriphagus sp.]
MEMPPEFKKPKMTLGDWIISVIIKRLPLIGFIMLIVWAVDTNTDPDKSNWAKAELIVNLIIFAIVMIFIAIIGFSFFTNFADGVDWSEFD